MESVRNGGELSSKYKFCHEVVHVVKQGFEFFWLPIPFDRRKYLCLQSLPVWRRTPTIKRLEEGTLASLPTRVNRRLSLFLWRTRVNRRLVGSLLSWRARTNRRLLRRRAWWLTCVNSRLSHFSWSLASWSLALRLTRANRILESRHT